MRWGTRLPTGRRIAQNLSRENTTMSRPPHAQQNRPRRFCRRKGSLTLQIVLVLPILLVATIAIIQLGFLLTLRQAVYHAATVGAREAAKGGDIDHVTCVVNSILRTHGIQVGTCASVILEDVAVSLTPIQAGTATCYPPPTPVLDGNEVRVTVCVDLSNQAFGAVGLCGTCQGFRASSVAQKEVPPENP